MITREAALLISLRLMRTLVKTSLVYKKREKCVKKINTDTHKILSIYSQIGDIDSKCGFTAQDLVSTGSGMNLSMPP